MKHLLGLFCILSFFSCNTASDNKNAADTTIVPQMVSNDDSKDQWYKVFSGIIDNKSYSLYLTKSDQFKGYFFNGETNLPVSVFSDPSDSTSSDSIILSGGNASYAVTLRGRLNDDVFAGTISIDTSEVSNKLLPFQLRENNNFTRFSYYFVAGKSSLPPELKNESTMEYRFGTIWPRSGDALSAHLKQFITSRIDSSGVSVSNPLQLLQAKKDRAIEDWHNETDTLSPKTAADFGLSLSRSDDENISVLYEDDSTIAIADFIYSYTGGAHGMYSTQVTNFSKSTGKKIELKDKFSPSVIGALPALLEKSARKTYNIPKKTSLEKGGFFVNTIKPSDSYYFANGGVGFYYAPYDLKPYAEGEIILFVPAAELNNYQKK